MAYRLRDFIAKTFRLGCCALFAVVGAGCGQTPYQPPLRVVEYPDEEETPAPAAKPLVSNVAATPAATPTATQSKPAVVQPKATPAAPATPIGRDDYDEQAPTVVPKPDFPANVAEWLPDDFRRARLKRSPKLLQAVRELAAGNELNPDKAQNAKLLAELLEPPPSETPAAPPPKKVAVGYDDFDEPVVTAPSAIPGLPQAIVEVLATNGTAEARAVLKKILLGKQASDVDDRTLSVAALRTLIEHFDAENEKVILAVLTVPDSIRPPGGSKFTGDQLHEECLRIIRPVASADFRLRLAQRMARGVSSAASRKRNMALLMSSDKANLSAKVELAVNGVADPAELATLDRELFQSSQQANEQLLRATPADWLQAKQPSNRNMQPVNDYDNYSQRIPLAEVADTVPHLWRTDFQNAVATRLAAAEVIQPNDPLVLIAASLPAEPARAALVKRWKANWIDDSATVANLGNYVLDPGLLVVLKQLPRDTPPVNPRAAVARQFPDTPQGQKMAKELAAKKAWLRTSENFTRTFIDRCKQFAEHRATAFSAPSAAQPIASVADFDQFLNSEPSLPSTNAAAKTGAESSPQFELSLKHLKDARIKLAYRTAWPDDLQGKLVNCAISPLEIYYVRLEAEGELEAVASHYGKQLKSAIIKPIDQGRWVDAIANFDQRVCSNDVFITRLDRNAAATTTRGGNEKFVIDILRITVPDPSSSTPPTAAVSQKP